MTQKEIENYLEAIFNNTNIMATRQKLDISANDEIEDEEKEASEEAEAEKEINIPFENETKEDAEE